MKKTYLSLFLFIMVVFLSSNSYGQLISFDNFNYADNDSLTANGWVAHSGGSTNTIKVGASNGLTYTGYSGLTGLTGVVPGNAAKLAANGEDVSKYFSVPVLSGTVYFSFMVKVSADITGYFIHVANNLITFPARFFVKPSATTGKINFGLSNTSTATYATTPIDYSLNTTYLVVVKYDMSTTNSSMWVLTAGVPVSELAAGTPEVTTTGFGTGTAPDSVARICLRQYATGQGMEIDGIRVSTSWTLSVVPVELTSFTAATTPNSVNLNWTTATEQNNLGFEVQRAEIKSGVATSWRSLSFITGHGTSLNTNSYSYVDNNMTAGKFLYRLKQIDLNGTYEFSKTIEAEIAVPATFELQQNFPNPFNPSTMIKYNLPFDSKITLKVFNSIGAEISTLESGIKSAGFYEVNFNALNLTSGIYYYTLSAISADGKANFNQTKKMILIK